MPSHTCCALYLIYCFTVCAICVSYVLRFQSCTFVVKRLLLKNQNWRFVKIGSGPEQALLLSLNTKCTKSKMHYTLELHIPTQKLSSYISTHSHNCGTHDYCCLQYGHTQSHDCGTYYCCFIQTTNTVSSPLCCISPLHRAIIRPYISSVPLRGTQRWASQRPFMNGTVLIHF